MVVFKALKWAVLSVFVVSGPASAQAQTVELSFGNFFVMPIGPRGLVPSPGLLALVGKPVRISGYLIRQDGLAWLSPQPVVLGDADEGLADDLPASTLALKGKISPPLTAMDYVSLTGILEIGPWPEQDGRISQIRLRLTDAGQNSEQP